MENGKDTGHEKQFVFDTEKVNELIRSARLKGVKDQKVADHLNRSNLLYETGRRWTKSDVSWYGRKRLDLPVRRKRHKLQAQQQLGFRLPTVPVTTADERTVEAIRAVIVTPMDAPNKLKCIRAIVSAQ